jgi:hypothetical protein
VHVACSHFTRHLVSILAASTVVAKIARVRQTVQKRYGHAEQRWAKQTDSKVN